MSLPWFLTKKGIETKAAENAGKGFAAWLAKHQGWWGVIVTHKKQISMGFLAFSGWVAAGCGAIVQFGFSIDPIHFIDHYFHWNLACDELIFPTLLGWAFFFGAGWVSSDERKQYELGLKTPPGLPNPSAVGQTQPPK